MKKTLLILLAVLTALTIFAGCTSAEAQQSTSDYSQTTTSSGTANTTGTQAAPSEMTQVNAEYDEDAMSADYQQSGSTVIMLDNDSTTISGSGASYKNGVVNIVNAGTYILSGSLNGQVVIEATSVDEVQIVLDNAEIINSTGTAIYIKQAEKAVITLADGSVNIVKDGSSYADLSDDAPDSAIYSDDDLIINGSGTLNVEGSYKHGIKCADDIMIISGTLNVTAANDGIRGKDSVAIMDGNITVNAAGDGITATNAQDADKGWISVDGGVFNIIAQNNGFQAESALVISDGNLTVKAGQDTYHCNNDISISGGTSKLDAGDDGMHADNNLQISAGLVDVVSDYEGIEGSNVYITGGEIYVEAVDDGINAAGGSDSDNAANDRFAQESGDNVIAISNGYVYVSIIGDQGDGLDSNGNIYLSGGVIVIDGGVSQRDAAIDINKGVFEYSGGTLTSVGSTAMLVIPDTVSQPVITIIFDNDQKAGEEIAVLDKNGNTVLSFTPKKVYPVAMLSSPELTVGETYTITVNSEELFTITLDSTTITVDGDGNKTEPTMTAPGGQRPGQEPGQDNRPMQRPGAKP